MCLLNEKHRYDVTNTVQCTVHLSWYEEEEKVRVYLRRKDAWDGWLTLSLYLQYSWGRRGEEAGRGFKAMTHQVGSRCSGIQTDKQRKD